MLELKADPNFHMNFASSMYSHSMFQVTGSIADSAELKASPSKDAAAVYGPMLERWLDFYYLWYSVAAMWFIFRFKKLEASLVEDAAKNKAWTLMSLFIEENIYLLWKSLNIRQVRSSVLSSKIPFVTSFISLEKTAAIIICRVRLRLALMNDETCIYEQTVTGNVQSQGQVERTLLGLIRSGK